MNWTHEEYKAYQNRRPKTTSKPKQTVCNESLEEKNTQREDSGRSTVCIISYTTRPKDGDNPCAKFHIDALRYENVIPNDTKEDILLFVDEFKVSTKLEERTEIYILKEIE